MTSTLSSRKRTAFVATLVLGAVAVTHGAEAQSVRTFVSGQGADSGTCTAAAPCRSFAYALTQTATKGEIVVLNTAGYGPVTITRSVNITNPSGVEAGISVGSGGAGISVNINPSDTVSLHGLTIEGNGVGATGIAYQGTGVLRVTDCVVRDMSGDGIAIGPDAAGVVLVADTTAANNAGDGIFVQGGGKGAGLQVSLSHITAVGNGFTGDGGSGYGVRLAGVANAYFATTIDTSLIAENGIGLDISTPGTPDAMYVFLVNSNILNNGQSVNVGDNATAFLEKTAIVSSSSGNHSIANNGWIFSFGDNAIRDTLTGNAILPAPLK